MIATSKLKYMRCVLASENIFKTTPLKFPLNIFQICQNMHFSAQKRAMNIQPWKVADANTKYSRKKCQWLMISKNCNNLILLWGKWQKIGRKKVR